MQGKLGRERELMLVKGTTKPMVNQNFKSSQKVASPCGSELEKIHRVTEQSTI